MVGELAALVAKVLLHERVDDNLLADGVARDFPRELPCPARLRGDVAALVRTPVLVVVLVHLLTAQTTWPVSAGAHAPPRGPLSRPGRASSETWRGGVSGSTRLLESYGRGGGSTGGGSGRER